MSEKHPESCPHFHECTSEVWPGIGAWADDYSSAMGGLPWKECCCMTQEKCVEQREFGPVDFNDLEPDRVPEMHPLNLRVEITRLKEGHAKAEAALCKDIQGLLRTVERLREALSALLTLCEGEPEEPEEVKKARQILCGVYNDEALYGESDDSEKIPPGWVALTPDDRFKMLLDELEKRFPNPCPVANIRPEMFYLHAIDEMLAYNKKVQE